MPATQKNSHIHRKRHGYHQKRTTHFLKVYRPFLPLAIILIAGFSWQRAQSPKTTIDTTQQTPSVLAYATNISKDALLDYTNQRRAAAGVNALGVNSQLTEAAQTKANDMAQRNYWSHNTPDGVAPWTFMTNAGYSYDKAGENLACGFNESSEVITGWYNSPSHRENLLNVDYKDVGFGIANADNYNCDKIPTTKQTIIVAMYGAPYTTIANTPKSSPPVVSQPTSQPTVNAPAANPEGSVTEPIKTHPVILTITDSSGKPSVNTKVTLHSDPQVGYTDKNGVVQFENVDSGDHTITIETNGAKSETPIKLTDDAKEFKLTLIKPVLTANQTSLNGDSKDIPKSHSVSRIEILTNRFAPWALALLIVITVAGSAYVLVKHSIAAHKFFVKGEKYILSHITVDVVVIGLVIVLYFLTRSVGAIL